MTRGWREQVFRAATNCSEQLVACIQNMGSIFGSKVHQPRTGFRGLKIRHMKINRGRTRDCLSVLCQRTGSSGIRVDDGDLFKMSFCEHLSLQLTWLKTTTYKRLLIKHIFDVRLYV